MTISSKSFRKDGHKIDEILADPFEENVHDLGTNISGHEIPEIEEREKNIRLICSGHQIIYPRQFLNFGCNGCNINREEKWAQV